MLLKFRADAVVGGKLTYKAGNTYEIDNALGSATRWIKRGMAEEVLPELPTGNPTRPNNNRSRNNKNKQAVENTLDDEQDKSGVSEIPDL